MIYNKEPMQVIVDALKDIAKDISIYKEQLNDDLNSIPSSYVVIKTDLTDSPLLYGDGKAVVRTSDCDIYLTSKGLANRQNSLHNKNIKKIVGALKNNELSYTKSNLGYDKTNDSTTMVFSVEINYIE